MNERAAADEATLGLARGDVPQDDGLVITARGEGAIGSECNGRHLIGVPLQRWPFGLAHGDVPQKAEGVWWRVHCFLLSLALYRLGCVSTGACRKRTISVQMFRAGPRREAEVYYLLFRAPRVNTSTGQIKDRRRLCIARAASSNAPLSAAMASSTDCWVAL